MRNFLRIVIACSPFYLGGHLLAQTPATAKQPQMPEATALKKNRITAAIITSVNNTYGYDILSDGKLLIHQPSVPGMPGNEGFKTKEAAKKTADFVIGKIHKGEMPPTVTTDELKALKVIPAK